MLLLALDTATPATTVGLVAVGDVAGSTPTLLAERTTVEPRRHGELLAPAIEAVLVEAGATPRDVAAVAAGVGPGPFTGLRVGLVTAAAFADALDIPAYAVCSLDALAALVDEPGVAFLVATDARRREVYWAAYDTAGRRSAGPGVGRPADLNTAGSVFAVGAGAVTYPDELGLPVRPEPRFPTGLAVAGLAAERARQGAPGESLTPLYLRRPDAVAPERRKAVLR